MAKNASISDDYWISTCAPAIILQFKKKQ